MSPSRVAADLLLLSRGPAAVGLLAAAAAGEAPAVWLAAERLPDADLAEECGELAAVAVKAQGGSVGAIPFPSTGRRRAAGPAMP